MFDVILVVCLLSGPGCREEPVGTASSFLECALASQPIAAAWAEAHPKYRVHRIICRVPRVAT